MEAMETSYTCPLVVPAQLAQARHVWREAPVCGKQAVAAWTSAATSVIHTAKMEDLMMNIY